MTLLDELIFSLKQLEELYGDFQLSSEQKLEMPHEQVQLPKQMGKVKEPAVEPLTNSNSTAISLGELYSIFSRKNGFKDEDLLLGVGNKEADLLVISLRIDSSNELSDLSKSFHGEASILFDKMLSAIDLKRTDIFETVLFKSLVTSPTTNSSIWLKLIKSEIDFIAPKAIWCFGRETANQLLVNQKSMNLLMKSAQSISDIPCFVSHHPKELLSNPSLKYAVWEQMKALKQLINSNE